MNTNKKSSGRRTWRFASVCGVILIVMLVACFVNGRLTPQAEAAASVKVQNVAGQVETGVSGITVMTAQDWAEKYPDVYESYMRNQENREVTDYLEEYPYLPVLYEPYGFSYSYGSARGHFYDVTDLTETGRPHALAQCITCKSPDFTAMVNEMGDAAYALPFEDALQHLNETISCYNCHANKAGEQVVVTHTYLIDAVGEDFDKIDAANLACGQCHVEYYFDPATKATTLPHSNLVSMSPDAILEYFNGFMVDGQPFADYTNPRTGVRQIKVQHPELETYLGEGSIHKNVFTCADCHMGKATSADGTVYTNHNLTSPLNNPELIASTCSVCHADLVSEVRAVQEKTVEKTNEVAWQLVDLTEKLATAVEGGEYSEDELNAIRAVARDAQFYWDFVFVENSEGAHNPALASQCLDKAAELTAQAMAMFK